MEGQLSRERTISNRPQRGTALPNVKYPAEAETLDNNLNLTAARRLSWLT